jgi:hypothetical protein
METLIENVPELNPFDFLTESELAEYERRHTAARDAESSKPHPTC